MLDKIKGCIYPWVHMYAGVGGEYRMCCHTDGNVAPMGNSSKKLSEVWNDEAYREVRLKFLKGDYPSECAEICFNREKLGIVSPRQYANSRYAKHRYKQDLTSADGSIQQLPIFYDIRYNNVCNFKCRYCSERSSTAWYADYEALTNKKFNNSKVLSPWDDDDFKNEFRSLVPHIEQIRFAGGEPLMQLQHYELLDYLIKHNFTNIELSYNTNLSVLTYKKYNILDMWSKFKKVSVLISCDGVGQKAEYIRDGFNWNTFTENVEKIKPLIQAISSVVSIPSISSMIDLIPWANKNSIHVAGNLLRYPWSQDIRVLPLDSKLELIKRYKIMLLEQNLPVHKQTAILKWLSYMMSEDRSHLLKDFITYNNKLDQLRDTKFLEVFPEFSSWYKVNE